jgi:hypothetical protein
MTRYRALRSSGCDVRVVQQVDQPVAQFRWVLYEEEPVVKAHVLAPGKRSVAEPGSRATGGARRPVGTRRALDAGVAGGGPGADHGIGTAASLRALVGISRVMDGGGAQFSIALVTARIRSMGGALRRRNSNMDRHAARTLAAPAGAKGCFVVNMCQMDSAIRRAMSTRAILVPRWRPSRRAVRW